MLDGFLEGEDPAEVGGWDGEGLGGGWPRKTGNGVRGFLDDFTLNRCHIDSDLCLRLQERLFPQIAADSGLAYVYGGIEIPVRDILFRMERNGVLIDADLLARQSDELGRRLMELEQEEHELAGSVQVDGGAARRVFRIDHHERRKPMTIDEALIEIEDRTYVVYRDAETDRVCILVRRDDGHFDLIEA